MQLLLSALVVVLFLLVEEFVYSEAPQTDHRPICFGHLHSRSEICDDGVLQSRLVEVLQVQLRLQSVFFVRGR